MTRDSGTVRERVVVALSGGPEGEGLLRRAAQIAAAAGGADLLAVHVTKSDQLSRRSPEALARQRALMEGLGGTYHVVVGDDTATALREFAAGVAATHLVVGSDRRGRWYSHGRGVATALASEPGEADVHIVGHGPARHGRRSVQTASTTLGRRRRAAGWVLATAGPGLLAFALSTVRDHASLTTDLLLFLALTVGVALVGGLWPAVVTAVSGFLLLNWYFTAPLHTFTVAELENTLALFVFVAVAVAVSSVVDLAARRTGQAARSTAEAETLSLLATSVLRGENALPALLRRVRETFGVRSVSLLERTGQEWATVGSTGPDPPTRPQDAEAQASVRESAAAPGDGHTVLALRGRVLAAADRGVLTAFASQATAALEWQRLAEEAAQARRLAEGNKIRNALLAAVSHDLRSPLASIKASVSSLRQTDVEWDADDEAELLATIEESADRLNGLIANLLDMSRLQSGVVTPLPRDVALEEVIPSALAGVPAERIDLDVPETLPPVLADPGLLERAIANVAENAVRHSGGPVLIAAEEMRFGRTADRVEVRVADRGPGVPDNEKKRIFAPFQRLGDVPQGSGVGLGLAVARGFLEAMGGSLSAADTPGGGLTMVFSLPVSPLGDAAGDAAGDASGHGGREGGGEGEAGR